jgi:hypothetical protein
MDCDKRLRGGLRPFPDPTWPKIFTPDDDAKQMTLSRQSAPWRVAPERLQWAREQTTDREDLRILASDRCRRIRAARVRLELDCFADADCAAPGGTVVGRGFQTDNRSRDHEGWPRRNAGLRLRICARQMEGVKRTLASGKR